MSKTSCDKPCPECPYTNKSIEGYFGGNDPHIYFKAIHSETYVPCHMRTKYSNDGKAINPESTVCVGQIMAQKKSCKRPRINQVCIEAHKEIGDPLPEVMSSREFLDHHGIDISEIEW